MKEIVSNTELLELDIFCSQNDSNKEQSNSNKKSRKFTSVDSSSDSEDLKSYSDNKARTKT